VGAHIDHGDSFLLIVKLLLTAKKRWSFESTLQLPQLALIMLRKRCYEIGLNFSNWTGYKVTKKPNYGTSSYDTQHVYVRKSSSSSIPKDEFDFIVVGAGSAGCVVANRLVLNDTKTRVLITEAGPPADQSWRVRMPSGVIYCVRNKRIDWCYETVPQVCSNIHFLLQ
jgi:GMC oxidoreductase